MDGERPPNDSVPRSSRPGPAGPPPPDLDDIVDEWGVQSFPASDPPQSWR